MAAERWQEAESILHAAFDCPISQREQFLAEACGSDRSLREAVEELLAADQEASGFLRTSRSQASASSLDEEEAGSVIGAYRILRVLGRGGMGIVYLAERADQEFDRQVAIKVVLPDRNPEPLLRRLRQERQILAGLEHPNIARLIDGGRTSKGGPYLVMEYVEGQRIDEYCDQRGLSTAARIDLFLTVCDAVRYAHQNLVVHRDLKPSNLLVTPEGVPKLLDFGIAKPLDAESFPTPIEGTETGLRPMTLAYASPEQLLGQAITTASDVYSLGVLLYELLSGQRPNQLEGRSPSERIEILVHGEPVRPSQAVVGTGGQLDHQMPITNSSSRDAAVARGTTVRQLQRELAGDLDQIVLKSLRKDPNRRYPSVSELADDLRRLRRGLPVQARPETFGYVAGKFVRRHQLGVAVALGFALVVSAFSANMAHQATRLEEERNRAKAEAATAHEVVAFLGGLFEGAEPAFHQGREISARELLDLGAASLESNEEVQAPETRAALASAIGKAYLELSDLDASRTFLEEALLVREGLPDLHPARLAESFELLSRLETIASNFTDAELRASRAVALRRSMPSDHVALARALLLEGQAESGRSALESARSSIQEGLTLLGESSDQFPAVSGLLSRELCAIEAARGNIEDARTHCSMALGLLTRAHGRLHPEVFECRRLLAGLDKTPQSVEAMRSLLGDQRLLFGPVHAQIVTTLVSLAGLILETAPGSREEHDLNTDEAVSIYREADTMQQQLFGPDHMMLAYIHAGLAHALDYRGFTEEALDSYRASVRVARANLAPDSIDLAWPLSFLGDQLLKLRRYEEAVPIYREANENLAMHMPEQHPVRVSLSMRYGDALCNAGHCAEGLDMLLDAIKAIDDLEFEKDPRTPPLTTHWKARALMTLATLDDCLNPQPDKWEQLLERSKAEGVSVLPSFAVLRERLEKLAPCEGSSN